MTISQRTTKTLCMRSGGICAFTGCTNELIYPESNNIIIGEICHIVSPKKNGPRWDKDFPYDKFDEIDNLILFCPTHHEIVDKDIDKYSVDKLKEMKKTHEDLIKRRLKVGKPWDCNISDLYYINIPRIAMLSAINGIEFNDDLIEIKYLHSLGFELNRVILKVIDIINVIKPNVLPIREIKSINTELIGLPISFDDNFRTKNMPYPHDLENGKFSMTGKLMRDPLISKKYHNFKLILTINPRWVTTTTSFGELASGWIKVSGISIVKQINKSEKTMIATPLILGIPRSPYEYLLSG